MNRCVQQLARSTLGGLLLRTWLAIAPQRLPVRWVYRSDAVLAFYHPFPAYPLHILILPLPAQTGLESLTNRHDLLLAAAINTASRIAADLALSPGWKLVVNAGRYQDVAVLHFHLIVESSQGNEKA